MRHAPGSHGCYLLQAGGSSFASTLGTSTLGAIPAGEVSLSHAYFTLNSIGHLIALAVLPVLLQTPMQTTEHSSPQLVYSGLTGVKNAAAMATHCSGYAYVAQQPG